MQFYCGRAEPPLIFLHGGAGPMDPSAAGIKKAVEGLQRAVAQSLGAGHQDLAQVVACLQELEDDAQFNAGFGSALQADGVPRLTAAVMDGIRQQFSGVISITEVRHPSLLALALQDASSRVLTGPGHDWLARHLELPVENLVTAKRLESWMGRKKQAIESKTDSCDTVGVIISDRAGQLRVGTSTGGRGFEEPGRISDSGTVAGTYASSWAAVAATGIGEEIVDDAVAVRIETRVRDGMSLEAACRKTLDEALARSRSYGWIALDAKGHWCAAHTTPSMSFLLVSDSGKVISSPFEGVARAP